MDETTPTHSQTFANVVLPQLFHGSPAQFVMYLSRDGTRFLEFYWNVAREQMPSALRASSFGLNFTYSEPDPHTSLTLVTLPKPAVDGDSHFTALVYRPERRILLVSDMTRVFNLERTSDEQGNPAGLVVQITPHLERVEMMPFGELNSGKFLDTVLDHLDD